MIDALSEITKIPSYESAKPVKLLDQRVLDLRRDLHENFDRIWKVLVDINHEDRFVSIHRTMENGGLDLNSAIIVMKAFRELPAYTKHLAEGLEALVLGPRVDLCCQAIPTIEIIDAS